MTSPPIQEPPAQEKQKSDLAREKLEMELKELRWKIKWWTQPITATALGVVLGGLGLYLTFLQFESSRTAEQDRISNEQQRDRQSRVVDRQIRFQTQIRSDIDEILRFPRDQSETISRVVFLLGDVETMMQSQDSENRNVTDPFPRYEKRRFTESLVFVVRDDCDFTRNLRDLEFANIVVTYWNDYSTYLKEDADKLDYILYKYVQTLEYLRKQNPGYFEEMRLSKGKEDYVVSPKYLGRTGEPVLFSHFLDIKDGFESHMKILSNGTLSDDEKRRKESVLKKFQAALCNRAISEDFLGVYFPDEPCTDVS
jgi:hypothetical protein